MGTTTRSRASTAVPRLVLVLALLALTGLFAMTTVDSTTPAAALGAATVEHVDRTAPAETAGLEIGGQEAPHGDSLTLLCLCAMLIVAVVIAARGAVLHRSTGRLSPRALVSTVRAARTPLRTDPWAWGISRT